MSAQIRGDSSVVCLPSPLLIEISKEIGNFLYRSFWGMVSSRLVEVIGSYGRKQISIPQKRSVLGRMEQYPYRQCRPFDRPGLLDCSSSRVDDIEDDIEDERMYDGSVFDRS